jgi:trehalose 6-phosphate phosphatase
MISAPPLPAAARCCVFLDIDGILLDFAPTPDEVRVDEPLRDLLRNLDRDCEGAVAFVSGRAIVDIDELFEPLYLAAAGVHGCERRDAAGHWRRETRNSGSLAELRERLADRLQPLDGVWLEDKGCALAIHFRRVPHLESPLRGALTRLGTLLPAELELLEGDHVIEIKPRGHDKGSAIEAFMKEAPFEGRLPVFIGDENTARDGLAAVRRLNGLAIGVGERGAGTWRLPNPSEVRRWLESFLLRDR